MRSHDVDFANPSIEMQVAACHVLYHFGQGGGYKPGSFVASLLRCFDKADTLNRGRLAEGFPVYAKLHDLAANKDDGLNLLISIARGGSAEVGGKR